MSVVNVKKSWSRAAAAGGRVTEAWTVLCDDPAGDDVLTAKRAAGIPRKGQAYAGDEWLIAEEPSVRTVGPLYYEVTVQYRPPETPGGGDGGGGGGGGGHNPLDERPEVSWGYTSSVEPVEADVTGAALTNTAGDAFDPPLTKEALIRVYRCVRNEADADAHAESLYDDSLNAEPWHGFRPGRCRMRPILIEQRYHGELVYYPKTYEVLIGPLTPEDTVEGSFTWYWRIANRGFRSRYLDGDGNVQHKAIRDGQGNLVSEPALLAEDGTELEYPYTPVHWILRPKYKLVSWEPLRLP